MGIYTLKNHRKIYEYYNGPIPAGVEIHHIDGNHSNNNPSNLLAVTLQEHYDIHYAQGDWHACHLIALRMKKPPEFLADLQRKRVIEGSHHFLGGEIQRQSSRKRVTKGVHNLLANADGVSLSSTRVIEGTHNFLGKSNNQIRLANKTHPSQSKKTCACGVTCDIGNYTKWHGDRCRKISTG